MVPKKRDFAKDPRDEILGNRSCQVWEASYQCITHLEVRDSSYFCLLSIFRPIKEGFLVKGLFGEEKLDFQVLHSVFSLRRR